MNKIPILLRLELRGLSLNKLRYRSKSYKIGAGVGFILLLLLAISYISGASFTLIYLKLDQYVPTLMVFLTSAVCLILTFMKGHQLLFKFRDFDTLFSLPIQPRMIIISRMLTLYLLNFGFALLVLLPSISIYSFHLKTLQPLLFSLLITPFIPLIPITVGAVLTLVISVIAAGFRHQQPIIILLTLGGLSAFMLGSLNLTQYDDAAVTQLLEQGLKQLEGIYPLLSLLKNGLTQQPWLLLLFDLISLLVFGSFSLLLDRFYLQINSWLGVRSNHKKLIVNKLTRRSIFSRLIRREARLYFSSSLYVINTVIGPFLFLLAAFSVPVLMKQLLVVLPTTLSLSQLTEWLPFVPCLFLGMSTPTSSAISMEGRNSWLLAALPIPVQQIYAVKILWNLIVFLPLIWSGCLILAISFPITAAGGILLSLLPSSHCLFIVTLSLWLNQKYHRFDWTNEQQIIKQSLPVLLTMLVGFLLILLLVGIAFVSQNVTLIGYIAAFCLVAGSLAIWSRMKKVNVFIV
ncbi:hypothetical protein [Enterococcus sp. LJL51]|uniref:hypothetical protein n=1 Tax=Enterococcus sp. LJL51 TaxID=3416656 RepID=UPI003CF2C984